jgi:hypothetical protein
VQSKKKRRHEHYPKKAQQWLEEHREDPDVAQSFREIKLSFLSKAIKLIAHTDEPDIYHMIKHI